MATDKTPSSQTKAAVPLAAPASAAEVEQRRANKALHSERVRHGGNPGAGEKR